MKRNQPFWINLVILTALAIPLSANAQLRTDSDEDEPLVPKIYQLGHLITGNSQPAFAGIFLPGIGSHPPLAAGNTQSRGGGFGGGGFGGGGGGFGGSSSKQGGGVFALPPQINGGGGFGGGGRGNLPLSSFETQRDSLNQVIRETIDPEGWDDTNGDYSSIWMQDMLIVRCPTRIHKEIASFIDQLTEIQKASHRTVIVKAYWVFVNENEYQALVQNDNQVDQAQLAQLLHSQGARAQVTCNNLQTVHIISGNLKSTIESAVPVVGQNSTGSTAGQLASVKPAPKKQASQVLAQRFPTPQVSDDSSLTGKTRGEVGYQPISRWVNYGGLLQVTPSIQSDNQIRVDVSSTVVLPKGQMGLKPVEPSISGLSLARHDLQVQQFANSATLPVGQPVVIGGSTLQISNTEQPTQGEDGKQLYLILEASIKK